MGVWGLLHPGFVRWAPTASCDHLKHWSLCTHIAVHHVSSINQLCYAGLTLRRGEAIAHWWVDHQSAVKPHHPTSTRRLLTYITYWHMLTQCDVWQVQVFLDDARQRCVQASMVGLARSSLWLTRSLCAKWCWNPTLLLLV